MGDGNAPLIYADLKRSPQIALIDLEGFFGRPGDCIRIYPKEGTVFNKVTVKVTDLCDRLLAHACATDAKRNQQWTFSYFPARRHPETENLIVTVTASHETRKPPKPLLDPYELTPDELGDYYREQEEYNTIFPEEEED